MIQDVKIPTTEESIEEWLDIHDAEFENSVDESPEPEGEDDSDWGEDESGSDDLSF